MTKHTKGQLVDLTVTENEIYGAFEALNIQAGIEDAKLRTLEPLEYPSFNDALIAAHRQSVLLESGRAFAVQWPGGHSTVEFKVPSLRGQRMKVVCCENGRETLA